MSEGTSEFENPSSDPEWLVTLTRVLSHHGTWAQVRRGQPVWRNSWDYTPFEALDAISGWARSPGAGRLSGGNWLSLIDDVARAVRPLHEILESSAVGGLLANFVGRLADLRRADPETIDWSTLRESIVDVLTIVEDPLLPATLTITSCLAASALTNPRPIFPVRITPILMTNSWIAAGGDGFQTATSSMWERLPLQRYQAIWRKT